MFRLSKEKKSDGEHLRFQYENFEVRDDSVQDFLLTEVDRTFQTIYPTLHVDYYLCSAKLSSRSTFVIDFSTSK